MRRNDHYIFFDIVFVFLTLLLFISCNPKPENKTDLSVQNAHSLDKTIPEMNKGNLSIAAETNAHFSENLKFAIKPTSEYVRTGLALATLEMSEKKIEIEALGKVAYDPRHIESVSTRIGGRIEKLYVHYRFQKIRAGQKIMDLYSPDIVTAEENLLFLLQNDSLNTSMISAAHQKLLLLGMSEAQLSRIIQAKKIDLTIGIYSKYGGHVHEAGAMENKTQNSKVGMPSNVVTTDELSVKEGMYLQKGQAILSVYDPNYVWIILNFYSDMQSLIHTGNSVRIVPETAANKVFWARIDFIEPFYRNQDKTLTARVYFDNSHLQIPIGSQVKSTLSYNTIRAGWLPESAIVSLGIGKVVFIKQGLGFKSHKVVTGITYKNKVQVLEGMTAKDTVAGNARYLMDSESFIKVND